MNFEKYKKIYFVLERIDWVLNCIAVILFVAGFYFTVKYSIGSLIVAGCFLVIKVLFIFGSSIWIGKQQHAAIVNTRDFFKVLGSKKELLQLFKFEFMLLAVIVLVTLHNLYFNYYETSIIYMRAGFFLMIILALGSSFKSYFRIKYTWKYYNTLGLRPYGDIMSVGDLRKKKDQQ